MFKILHTEKEVLTVERTTLQTPDGVIIRALEYVDSNGKVIDSIVRTKHGYELDDLALTDEIWEFLDAQNLSAENAENTNLDTV